MPQSLIRFTCSCGKRVAAPAKFAGRSAECPKCGKTIVVPAQNPPSATPVSPPAAALQKCAHPRLDDLYRLVLKEFEGRIAYHDVTDGCPTFRFELPDRRRQEIRLLLEKDDSGREWLVVRSEIGTLSLFDEAAKALRLNRRMPTGRLFLDDFQVLQLEDRVRLDEATDAVVVQSVKAIARWADEFEEQLFGIDLR